MTRLSSPARPGNDTRLMPDGAARWPPHFYSRSRSIGLFIHNSDTPPLGLTQTRSTVIA
ncbi:MAG: hypothetical protein IIA62_00975 [Nitrospinae bacterium]|nr:hypothetical protein [Nitrospinota bacterium]